MHFSLGLGQVVAECSILVLQKAPIGAFCNTFMLHLENEKAQ